jgi:(p)ppGpp synthase/HD superfamily hydrolase
MAESAPSVVALAEELARRYHAGQCDRLGEPYVDHPREAAAWLHDVLEHTDATADGLRADGVPAEVVRLVEVLTRRPGEDYLAFIGRVCADPDAVRVKIADALHNLDPTRDFGPTPEQRARYHEALVRLFRANLP